MFAEAFGVDGYYVRIAPPALQGGLCGRIDIRNRPGKSIPAIALIGMDYLYLCRLGLRDPRDVRIQNTLKVSEGILRVETPHGVAYRRYNEDGYGEHEDGSPFDGSGIGRAWPLLTGERGHLDLLLGIDPLPYLEMMARMTGPAGLIPEQIWDVLPIPERGLQPGKPTGSAMPLVWAHAEYIKLRRSIQENRVFDTPRQTVQRYLVDKIGSPHVIWRFNHKCQTMTAGKTLRVELLAAATIHWGQGDWQRARDVETHDTGLGVHFADLPTEKLPAGTQVRFTFRWREAARWEGCDFAVGIEDR